MPSQTEKALAFRAPARAAGRVHHSQSVGCRHRTLLAALGFEALATTSLGLANMLGHAGSVGRAPR